MLLVIDYRRAKFRSSLRREIVRTVPPGFDNSAIAWRVPVKNFGDKKKKKKEYERKFH
jgi:hypothetical protein